MSQTYLSMGRAKELVVEIVESSSPGTKNPRDGSMCLYHCPKTGKRCIVGELLHRMKMPAPLWNGSAFNCGAGVPYVQKGYLSEATREWLGQVQNVFDGGPSNPSSPLYESRTWRQALRLCRQESLL